ncbi:family 10 glycosylhydrolase [Myxococcota bacterium]|nr:family 10 glycosylhydrolase [Myxococcota bacterium]
MAETTPANSPRPRAMWVLAEGSQRVLENPPLVEEMLRDAERLQVTDLIVQVYRGGRAWFDSSLADATPYRRAAQIAGQDPLANLVRRAHDRGIRVHAWVNVLSLANNRDAPLVRDLGRDAVMVDRRGRSILDYPSLDVPMPDRRYYRMGTPAVWIDPAAPGVADRLVETFSELMQRYPELDGLHLDYIRYPDVLPFSPGSRFGVGLDFGYGAASRKRFEKETQLRAPLGDNLGNANRWDTWRREQVTALVARIRESMLRNQPNAVLSAAVWAYPDRAYLALGQDWRGWLDAGTLDLAIPMAYTLDDHLLREQVQGFAGLPKGDRIWVGLGSWLFAKNPQRALRQLEIVRDHGASGEALFSWDSIASEPDLKAALELGMADDH